MKRSIITHTDHILFLICTIIEVHPSYCISSFSGNSKTTPTKHEQKHGCCLIVISKHESIRITKVHESNTQKDNQGNILNMRGKRKPDSTHLYPTPHNIWRQRSKLYTTHLRHAYTLKSPPLVRSSITYLSLRRFELSSRRRGSAGRFRRRATGTGAL